MALPEIRRQLFFITDGGGAVTIRAELTNGRKPLRPQKGKTSGGPSCNSGNEEEEEFQSVVNNAPQWVPSSPLFM